jgi:hypothetical protein
MSTQFLKTKKEIIYWLDSLYIEDYIVNDDLTVDVDNRVYINKKIKTFKVQFNQIQGSFVCSNTDLISLEGSPKIVKDTFNCSDNNLTSLKYSPQMILGNFICSFNQLTSLKGSPNKVGRLFEAASNQLTNLDFCPEATIIDVNENPIKNIGNNILQFEVSFNHSCFANSTKIEEFQSYYKKNQLTIDYDTYKTIIEKTHIENILEENVFNCPIKKNKL